LKGFFAMQNCKSVEFSKTRFREFVESIYNSKINSEEMKKAKVLAASFIQDDFDILNLPDFIDY
jgi:hypothetical protein